MKKNIEPSGYDKYGNPFFFDRYGERYFPFVFQETDILDSGYVYAPYVSVLETGEFTPRRSIK